ncbi:MAG: energy transducer TonB [Myxococcales bacterium]|nr:energy transducer TonB [Myxococcales bacterium]
MGTPAVRVRRRVGSTAVAVALAGGAHAAVLGAATVVEIGGWGGLGGGRGRAVDLAPLAPSCDGRALLAASVAVLACAAPWIDDGRRCLAELDVRLRSDLASCHARTLAAVPVELATFDPAELAQIDPEPLLASVTPEAQRAFEQAQAERAAEHAAEVERTVNRPRPDAQVIEQARPDLELAPERARFVSEYDVTVARETVARGSDRAPITRRAAAGADHPALDELPPEPAAPSAAGRPGSRGAAATPGAMTPAALVQEARRQGVLDGARAAPGDGLAPRRGDGAFARAATAAVAEHGGGDGDGGDGGRAGAPLDLRPRRELLERALGGGSVDAVDVADGDETALNARQWVHASFFNRLKRAVHQQWHPIELWRRHDPTGAVYGVKTRVTRLRVSLTPTGAVAQIVVVEPSGVDVLDDEAVRAFETAQPFANPPAALIGGDGRITFVFGFHLEVGGVRTEWQLFR